MEQEFNVKIKCDDLKLFSQGTIVCSEKNEISFEIISDAYISFVFKNDSENKEIRIEKQPEGNKLILKFLNFNNSLGTSISGPMPIGIINNKQISFTATVTSIGKIGDSIKTINYNFYSKDVL